ncbi:hypothetical protein GF319_03260 [Candidatus Bathyarchaeota archaeon]|nr:hypothetical protein [Candidatus Bathyarchaeota archaeon]
MVDQLAKIYEETVLENVQYLKQLENELFGRVNFNEEVHGVLTLSSQNITQKWLSGKKYLRTKYARNAILEYPDEVLKLSILLDSNINLMDDILDEALTQDETALYLVELLRVLALRESYVMDDELRMRISNYFNKLIFVAVSEKLLLEKIGDYDGEDFNRMAYNYFKGRSIDMDLFLEIPLLHMGYDKSEINEILVVGRLLRIVNLIKKDIADLKHDLKSDITTPITVLHEKNKSIKELVDYVFSRSVGKVPQKGSRKADPIMSNLTNLLLKEQEELNKTLAKNEYKG